MVLNAYLQMLIINLGKFSSIFNIWKFENIEKKAINNLFYIQLILAIEVSSFMKVYNDETCSSNYLFR